MLRLQLRLRCGGDQDEPGKQGTAHFLEHIIFQTQDPETRKMINEFKALGGSIEAYTNSAWTTYCFMSPKGIQNEALAQALAARMVFKPQFDDNDMNKERSVIINEYHDHCEEQEKNIGSQIKSVAFDLKGQVEPVIGNEETLQNLDAQDLKNFHARYYKASNAEIEITGHSSGLGFFNDIKNNFGHLPDLPAPGKPPPSGKASYKGGYSHLDMDVRQAQFGIAFKITGGAENETSQDSARKYAESSVLRTYIHNQVLKHLRQDQRQVYSPTVFNDFKDQDRILSIHLRTRPETADTVLPTISRIITDMAAGKIDDNLFQRTIAACAREIVARGETTGPRDVSSPLHRMRVTRDSQAALQKVTKQDLINIVKSTMLASPPTLVTGGDVSKAQSYEEFKAMLPPSAAKADMQATPTTKNKNGLKT